MRAKSYRPDPNVVDLTNAAIYLRRPLLVTGKPGTGKSTLAHSIAWELKLGPVLYWSITSRAHLQDGLYRYDAVGRLQQANLQRLGQGGPPATDISQFITLGPLGTALSRIASLPRLGRKPARAARGRARPRALGSAGDGDCRGRPIKAIESSEQTPPRRKDGCAPVRTRRAAARALRSSALQSRRGLLRHSREIAHHALHRFEGRPA